jgi:hypothetical protein
MRRLWLWVAVIGALSAPSAVKAQEPELPGSMQDSVFAIAGCYARQMGLTQMGWKIALDFGSFEEFTAGTAADPSYWGAEIAIDTTDFRNLEVDEWREIIVHELLHIAFWEPMALAYEYNETMATHFEERAITHLSQRPFWLILCRFPDEPMPYDFEEGSAR